MSQTIENNSLPAVMQNKLQSVRWRKATLALSRAVAIAAAVLIAGMVLAMAIDWWFTLFSTSVRTALTSTCVAVGFGAFCLTGLQPLIEAFGWNRAAANVDNQIPQLEERWTTVASFNKSDQQPESQTGQAMLQQVTSEAVAMSSLVKPSMVVRPTSLKPAGFYLAATLLLLALFMVSNWAQTSILMQRFWAPTDDITATQLTSETQDQIVPRGEAIDIVTRMSGVPRETATILLDVDEFGPEEIELSRDENSATAFICRLDVDESFRYQVLSGDGRTQWHSVTAIDYPELEEVQLTVTAPEYVDREPFEKTLIPGRIRAIQGSHLKLEMRPNAELASFNLQLTFGTGENAEQQTLEMKPDADGWYRYTTQITEDFSMMPVLMNQHELSNEDRRICNVHVITDKAPVARVINPTDEMAVSATDVLDIKFEAHDDHGIATAELVVYDESNREEGEEPKVLMVKEIPLEDQQLQKHVMGLAKLDLKELGLEEGQSISYAVRVTDNRDVKLDPEEVKRQQSMAGKQKNSRKKDANEKNAPNKDSKIAANGEPPHQNGDASKEGKRDKTKPHKLDTKNMMADATDATDARNAEMQKGMLETADAEKKNADAQSSLANDKKTPLDDTKKNGLPKDDTSNGVEDDDAEKGSEKSSDGEKDSTKKGETDTEDGKSSRSNKGAEPNSEEGKSDDKDAKNTSDGTKNKTDKDKSGDTGESKPRVAVASKDGQQTTKGEDKNKDPQEAGSKATETQKPNDDDDIKDGPKEPKSDAAGTAKDDKTNGNKPSSSNSPANNQNSDKRDPSSSGASGNTQKKESPQKKDDAKQREDKDKQGKRAPGPRIAMKQMSAQTSESGQKKETKRRKLNISERLAAIAEATQRKAADGAYRKKLIELDELLSVVEEQLNNLLKGVNQDLSQSDQFRKMDEQLGDVEQVVSDFRDETRDTEFVFIGQQLLVIKRTHVTPARDYVFAAIKEPDAAAQSFAEDSRHHVMTAREQLQALIKKYDRVRQDRKYKEKIEESIAIYEVYVEKAQALMRAARQGSKDPFKRQMAVIETDQEYLDRAAEVATLQRELMDEIGRLLADDPRLLAKYMELIKRRRSSLWQQFTDLHDRQDEISQEVSGWVRVDDSQRENLWILFAELRLHNATDLVKEAVDLAERMESQVPLVMNATQGTAAEAVKLAQQIALDARRCSLDAKEILKAGGNTSGMDQLTSNAARLNYQLSELEAVLDQIAFEAPGVEEINEYVDLRQAETRVLADQADAWAESAASIQTQAFHKMAYVDQQETTISAELLRIDMLAIESDLAPQFTDAENGMPQELANMTRELLRLVEGITFNQQSAAFSLKQNQMERAARQQELALQKFEDAESLFKRLRRKTADALDELPVNDPNIANLRDPTLDQFLRQLEREPNVEAQLGIPRRPTNLRRRQNSMSWQQGGGGGGGGGDGEDGNGTGGLDGSARAAMERIKREMQTLAGGKKKPKPKVREMSKEEKERQQAQVQGMKKMIEQAAKQAQEQADDPDRTPAQRQQAQQQAERMQRILQQMKDGGIPDGVWDSIAEAEEAKAMMEALANGEAIPDEQWNKLRSRLDDGIGQVNRRTPPEDYVPAIDHYQNAIRQIAPLAVE